MTSCPSAVPTVKFSGILRSKREYTLRGCILDAASNFIKFILKSAQIYGMIRNKI